VDALAPTDRDFVKWDGELKGFGVRVRPSGAKSFIDSIELVGATARGARSPSALWARLKSKKRARRPARFWRARNSGGITRLRKAKARAEKSVSDLCDLYLAKGCETKKRSTVDVDRGRIARHIKPLLGKKRVGEVTRVDIDRFMRDVAAGRTAADIKTGRFGRAIVEGGKGTATRTVGLLGGIFTFAVERGLRADNRVRGVKRFPDKKSETILTHAELTKLGAALSAAEADGGNSSAIAIIRFLAFTGSRKSEIAKLKWSEIDFERGYLSLADTKTGQKIKQIGAPALEVLSGFQNWPRKTGQGVKWIFCLTAA